MEINLSDIPVETINLASGPWLEQSPLEPLPGYFKDDPEEWLRRHNRFTQQTQSVDAEVLLVGDSITEAWSAPEQTEIWNETFEGYTTLNFGIGGDRTQQILWRLQNGNVQGLNPKTIVLMIGVNNLWDDVPFQPVARGIMKVRDELHRLCPDAKIIHFAILPAGENPEDDYRKRGVAVNNILKARGFPDYVQFVEMGSSFIQADGKLSADLMPDFCHLSPEGYRIWSKTLRPLLHPL